MKKEKKVSINIDQKLIEKKCDKCCATCHRSIDRGTWLQCSKDSKEVSPWAWCPSYFGDGH